MSIRRRDSYPIVEKNEKSKFSTMARACISQWPNPFHTVAKNFLHARFKLSRYSDDISFSFCPSPKRKEQRAVVVVVLLSSLEGRSTTKFKERRLGKLAIN